LRSNPIRQSMPKTPASVCTSCKQPLNAVTLEGHYTAKVQVDICTHCHLVWFDPLESVRLSGLGWVQLIRQMIASPALNAPLATRLSCVRCQSPLKAVRNLTRFGRSAAQECPRGHGHYQGYSLLLAERGLVRPTYPHDRQALRTQGRSLACLNCGAPMENAAQDCNYCHSPLVMVDVPRLTAALLLRFGDAVPIDSAAQLWAFDCIGCGQALNPTSDIRCTQCDQSVALPQLHLLTPLLNHVEPILLGRLPRQARPWGERLRRLQGDVYETNLYRVLHHLLGPGYLPGQFRFATLIPWVLLGCFLLWVLHWRR
jgi:Transcription factor zinc-finger